MFHNNTFILGDSAYASSNWIVTSFRDDWVLSDSKKGFKYIHSSTRTVENAFAFN